MPSEDARALARAAHPLEGASNDYDSLLDAIGDARFVLIGEASHGTHEFYNERARITERLIKEKGFHAVAAEADWPDAYRVNRYLSGHSSSSSGSSNGGDDDALRSLEGFERFPRWMWRNRVVLDFVADAAARNATVPERDRTGFYGLDLYSLYGSIDAVVHYLDSVDPDAAARARARYGCLEEFAREPQLYGRAIEWGGADPCEDEAVEQLTELLRRAGEYARRDGQRAEDEFFYAEQNARLIVNAEEYYRAMYRGGRSNTWNLRDTHMADTLDALDRHLSERRAAGGEKGAAKIVVWAHNSHLGDARATEMGEARDEVNLGQLVRERHPGESFLIGFTSYDGTVTAADDWGEPARRMTVRPGMAGSYEGLFHAVGDAGGPQNFWLDLRRDPAARRALAPRLERAIGVIYRPGTERWSHYFRADLKRQFDAMLHFDRTRAVEPLELTPGWSEAADIPETYPTGM